MALVFCSFYIFMLWKDSDLDTDSPKLKDSLKINNWDVKTGFKLSLSFQVLDTIKSEKALPYVTTRPAVARVDCIRILKSNKLDSSFDFICADGSSASKGRLEIRGFLIEYRYWTECRINKSTVQTPNRRNPIWDRVPIPLKKAVNKTLGINGLVSRSTGID